MALDFSALSAWVKENPDLIFQKTVMGSDTPNLASILKLDGVKGTINLPSLNSDQDTLQDGDGCGFSANGDTTFTKSTITPVRIKDNREFCVQEMEDFWTRVTLAPGQYYDGLGTLESQIIQSNVDSVRAQLEKLYWQGDTTGATGTFLDRMDGFNKIVADAILATTITATSTGAINNTTALGFVEGLKRAALADPDMAGRVYDGSLTMIMGVDKLNAYQENYRSTYSDYVNNAGFSQSMVEGTQIKINTVNGLNGQDVIYLVRNDNMVITNDALTDDASYVMGMDQYQEELWAKMRVKIGVGFRDITEGFYHI